MLAHTPFENKGIMWHINNKFVGEIVDFGVFCVTMFNMDKGKKVFPPYSERY
jgi:hypothetical protein